jgi:4-amino-4-deoxy-L-arabinose transferase-like glycosyltransferase
VQLGLILLFVFVNLTLHINRVPLFQEEPRAAIIAQEMLFTGEYLVPTFLQEPSHDVKPPLQNWLIAAISMKSGIVSNFNARIFTIVAFLLLGVLVYALLERINADVAFAASAIVLTNFLMLCENGNKGEPDMLLTVFTFLGYFFYIKNPVAIRYIAVSSVFTGLGILAKGIPMAYLYPGLLIHSLLAGQDRWKRVGFLTCHALLSLILPAIWLLAYSVRGDIFSLFGGFSSGVMGKTGGSFWMHITAQPLRLLAVFLPWSLVLAFAFKRSETKESVYRSSLWMAVCTFVLLLVLVHGSRDRYFMPAFPFLAIAAAHHVDLEKRLSPKISRLGLLGLSILCIGLGIYCLIEGYYISAVAFLIAGITSLGISRKEFTIFGFAVTLGLFISVVYENGFYFSKTQTSHIPDKVAGDLVKHMERGVPIVISVVGNRVAMSLERVSRQPVYSRPMAAFDKYYLVTRSERLDPQCEEVSQTTFWQRRLPPKKTRTLFLRFCSASRQK